MASFCDHDNGYLFGKRRGTPWLVERLLDSKKDHAMQLHIHIM